MRNIVLSDFDSLYLKNLGDCEAFCQILHDIYAYGKGKIIKSSEGNIEVICNLTENLYPVVDETDIPRAVDISFCYEKDLLYLILFNGDIVSMQVKDLVSESIVGSVEDGIKASQWSPNEEVIALVTGNDNVIIMTQDFDPVSEVHLHGGGFGEKQFITVGWGKKETQFHGSEGKFNAKKKKSEELNLASENDDTVRISWRGDAEYFVISSINPDTARRYLRIFSKNGILQYTSEDINGLEDSLGWSPSGSLIASTQILPNKYVVCFFEKNGLRHGEFKLLLSSQEIKVDFILWNSDSKILAILVTNILSGAPFSGTRYIQLYTVSNYHWYCKYTVNFDLLSMPLIMRWDALKPNTLNIILKRENKIYLNKYSFLWMVNKSKGSTLNDESLVAVIDGCNLNVTLFSKGIIPPPMYTHQIQLPVPINYVSFAPDVEGTVSSNDLFVQLSNDSLLVFKFVKNGSNKIKFEYMGEVKFCNTYEVCFNVQWVGINVFMLCTVQLEEEKVKPYLTVLEIVKFKEPSIDFEREDIPLQSTIRLLRASVSNILIHNNDGELYSFSKGNKTLSSIFLSKKTLLDLEMKDTGNGGFNFFSLDTLNKFHINNNLVSNNVISFHIHENFILLTTMKHELLCFHAETEITNGDLSEVSTRKIERGSRIVTSVHKDSRVILQMPRGNLECVQPRALSLFVLGEYLDSLSYLSAFDLMRKQRINLNLLYDHNPVLFSKNINVFLDQIKDLQWVSLFLSDLSDEDVTQTMYSVIYKNKNNQCNVFNNKTDIVCDLIEKALIERENSDKYILPLLTCYIKRRKTEFLECALLKLKELKEKEKSGVKLTVSFDEAFKYILYIIDVEELYKVALGMYDFDLVLIIASKSQKDPKEYLQFLNELKQLEPNYRKFRIDKYLKRHEKALANLVTCEGNDISDECIHFIKTHKLYKHALKLIPENTDRCRKLYMCYGEELMNNNCYEEAGFMYSKAGSYRKAMDGFRKSGNWQEVLFCATELKLDDNELQELFLDLAMELCELKNYKESAIIYLEYLKDVEECVRALSKGKCFAEAYRISHLHQRIELINLTIVPEIIEQSNQMHLYIANAAETLVRQKNRLRLVRKQKAETKERNEFDDLYSETNTIITHSITMSQTTNRTYRSAKNRRKQERKLLSLKEGSPYEDLALVTSLHNLFTNCIALKSEVKELNKFLLKIGELEKAEQLQKELGDLLQLIESSKSEIWIPDLFNSRQVYGPESTSNEKSSMYMRSHNLMPVLLNPKYAIAPEMQDNIKWQLEVLNS